MSSEIRILCAGVGMTPVLEAALKDVRFSTDLPDTAFAEAVRAVNRELEKVR